MTPPIRPHSSARLGLSLATITFITFATCITFIALPRPAAAHPLSPAHLVIDLDDQGADITLNFARDSVEPTVIPPPTCTALRRPSASKGESSIHHYRWTCASPTTLSVIGKLGDPPLIVELRRDHSPILTTLLDAATPTLDLATSTTTSKTFLAWVGIGAEHLFGGLDHVLLVVGLVLLIGLSRRLVWALTAFTLGHSASLALGATGVVTLPSALVETAIALTLVLLALDLAAPRFSPDATPRPSIFARTPWLTGTVVGVVHGLGFAGVLTDLGLPQTDTTLALLAFNLGLEVAQLTLVACLALALFAFTRLMTASNEATHPRLARSLGGWAIGVISSAWVIERAFGF